MKFKLFSLIKYPLLLLELFWSLLTFYIFLALFGMFFQVGNNYVPKKNGVEIYIRTDGIHTDFIVPVKSKYKNWNTIVPWENLRGKDTTFQFVAFGWGDQGFFLNTPEWSDLKFSTAFDALFYRGKTAIHVVFQAEPQIGKLCKKLVISDNQYLKLVNYIEKSFQFSEGGLTICIPNKGYWDFDAFYESKGKYSLFSTCNSWINGGLKESDLPACLWTPLSYAIFDKYE
jgi:uncharacterized protein (TIGR02117 family)